MLTVVRRKPGTEKVFRFCFFNVGLQVQRVERKLEDAAPVLVFIVLSANHSLHRCQLIILHHHYHHHHQSAPWQRVKGVQSHLKYLLQRQETLSILLFCAGKKHLLKMFLINFKDVFLYLYLYICRLQAYRVKWCLRFRTVPHCWGHIATGERWRGRSLLL